jgi:N-acetylmuramoyl-L-alanine amidase
LKRGLRVGSGEKPRVKVVGLPAAAASYSRTPVGDESLLSLVVIDPGHGGGDPGAVGRKRKLEEKDVTMAVGRSLAVLLRQRRIGAILTREKDIYIPLSERAEEANRQGADFFISIHVNASIKPDSHGIETYVFDLHATDAEAAELAKRENKGAEDILAVILKDLRKRADEPYSLVAARCVQEQLVRRLRWEDRGVKRAPFFVISRTQMPAILVEIGFISNSKEERSLGVSRFRRKIARALADAITEYARRVAGDKKK